MEALLQGSLWIRIFAKACFINLRKSPTPRARPTAGAGLAQHPGAAGPYMKQALRSDNQTVNVLEIFENDIPGL